MESDQSRHDVEQEDSLMTHAEQLPLLLIPLEPMAEIRDPICVYELLKDY